MKTVYLLLGIAIIISAIAAWIAFNKMMNDFEKQVKKQESGGIYDRD